jgi:hypothetical protein
MATPHAEPAQTPRPEPPWDPPSDFLDALAQLLASPDVDDERAEAAPAK